MSRPTPMPTLNAAPPSAIDELTDEIWEAICNEQDMDTSHMDFARAIVRDVPLVNAAPDLLAALSSLANTAEGTLQAFTEMGRDLPALRRSIEAARAAIAKAKGAA